MVSHACRWTFIAEEGHLKIAAHCTVAGLSLLGCADEVAQGGGQGEGIQPSKGDVLQNPDEPKPADAADVQVVTKFRLSTASADAICEGCVVTTYSLVDNSYGLDEMRVVSDGGMPICKIYLTDGGVVIDECGWSRP
jgi:hypothetical protein